MRVFMWINWYVRVCKYSTHLWGVHELADSRVFLGSVHARQTHTHSWCPRCGVYVYVCMYVCVRRHANTLVCACVHVDQDAVLISTLLRELADSRVYLECAHKGDTHTLRMPEVWSMCACVYARMYVCAQRQRPTQETCTRRGVLCTLGY